MLVLGLARGTLAQAFAPATPPPVPDPARSRAAQPQPAMEAAASQDRGGDPSAAGERIFSTTSELVFEMQPASHPQMPSPARLMQTSVKLRRVEGGFSGSAEAAGSEVTLTLWQLSGCQASLTESARVVIQQAVTGAIHDAGVGGVACLLEPPRRPGAPNTIQVVVAQVSRVRTIGLGARAESPEGTTDAACHEGVRQHSPIHAGDLLRHEVLTDYLYSLSRFPGRTVSAVVSAEPSSAQVVLDYVIQERSVFDVYASISNTGTSATDYWQERVGVLATQLSNNDDILSLDYVTASFSGAQNVSGYYDARVGSMEDLRWRVTGQWGQYNSSDVGLADEPFTGSNWGVQGDLIWTFHRQGRFWLDFDASVKGWNSRTSNPFLSEDGDATFVTASGTVDALAIADAWAFQGSVGFSANDTGASAESLDALGRTDTSPSWTTLNASVYGSVYLDPLFDPAWRPGAGIQRPLAHEIFGSVRGQYAFDSRLTPLAQYVMGGLYTVRGFPQSVTAGDSAVVGTLEYRLHLPRLLSPAPPVRGLPLMDRGFRVAADRDTGSPPDWDLAVSAFVDLGSVASNGAFPFEANSRMNGAGVGLDLTLLRNVSVSLDWAWALNGIELVGVQAGSGQFWFSASVNF